MILEVGKRYALDACQGLVHELKGIYENGVYLFENTGEHGYRLPIIRRDEIVTIKGIRYGIYDSDIVAVNEYPGERLEGRSTDLFLLFHTEDSSDESSLGFAVILSHALNTKISSWWSTTGHALMCATDIKEEVVRRLEELKIDLEVVKENVNNV